MPQLFCILLIALAVGPGLAVAQESAAVAVTEAEVVSDAPAEEVVVVESIIRPAAEHEIDEYLWQRRLVIVFADGPEDPRFVQQMDLLNERLGDLEERDVVVLTDTDSVNFSPLREKLRPRGFMLMLIGKDGNVYLRKPFPWSVREITRSIDKMPLRQQEIRDRR